MRLVTILGRRYFVTHDGPASILYGVAREVLIPARVKRRGGQRWTERFIRARRARDVDGWYPSWGIDA